MGPTRLTAFRYQMTVEIEPFVNISPDLTNYVAYTGIATNDKMRCNR